MSNKISTNRIMVPNKKSNQSYFRHVDGKSESFLPNRVKSYGTNRIESQENTKAAADDDVIICETPEVRKPATQTDLMHK